VAFLTTNRLHFELPQFGAVFDGHVDGSTIEGFFTQGTTTTFSLTAAGRPEPDSPIDGRWQGQIGSGATKIGIAVTFETASGGRRATIDVPTQGLVGLPLSNVRFDATVTLGKRGTDQALPMSATNRAYLAQYPWGDAAIELSLG